MGQISVRVRRASPAAASSPVASAVAVRLAFADGDPEERTMVVEVEPALALDATARALGRAPPRVVSTAPLDADAQGAFAAVVASLARRAAGDRGLRVLDVGPAGGSLAGIALSLTVLVDDEAYAARAIVPASFVGAGAPWTRDVLTRLGATPLSAPIVACAWTVTVSDIASLRPGDVLVASPPPACRHENGAWTGAAWLAPPAADTGVRIELVDGGAIVLRAGPELLDRSAMTEPDAGDALVTAIGDVPVVVRVEIGEATMQAREWAALARGDVVALGRRVGDRVVLRVGGVPVARGELVEIDGEVGVRIAERLDERGDERTP
jgi:type III secretion system YscQ/HrcQ family protein